MTNFCDLALTNFIYFKEYSADHAVIEAYIEDVLNLTRHMIDLRNANCRMPRYLGIGNNNFTELTDTAIPAPMHIRLLHGRVRTPE